MISFLHSIAAAGLEPIRSRFCLPFSSDGAGPPLCRRNIGGSKDDKGDAVAPEAVIDTPNFFGGMSRNQGKNCPDKLSPFSGQNR